MGRHRAGAEDHGELIFPFEASRPVAGVRGEHVEHALRKRGVGWAVAQSVRVDGRLLCSHFCRLWLRHEFTVLTTLRSSTR